jgi:hypothetical protein
MTLSPRLVSVFVCLALLLGARSVSAQNLLTNPDFNTDLSGWSTFGAVFDGTAGSPSPGSAQFGGSIATTNSTIFVSLTQCVSVVAGNSYDASGQLRLSSAPSGGTAFVAVAWYTGASCTSPVQTDGGNGVSGAAFQKSGGSFVAPAGAVSANFTVWIATSTTPGSFTGNLDDAFLGTPGPPPVPTMSTAWLTFFGAGLLGAGVMALRRQSAR